MAYTKFNVRFPFVVREALVVAQTTARKIWRECECTGQGDCSSAPPAPMTIRIIKINHPEEEPEYHKKYGVATVYFHFEVGMAVTVKLISWLSGFGEHWGVESVRARFYAIREGRGRDRDKTEKSWTGEELDQLAKLWGNRPYRWKD